MALWHERDISHSSAERVILPDSTIALHYLLHLFTGVMEGLRVFPERMLANLDLGGGLAFSQGVLLALIGTGLSRDEAYAIVQRAAAAAWDEGGEFRDAAAEREEVKVRLSPAVFESLFDPTSRSRTSMRCSTGWRSWR